MSGVLAARERYERFMRSEHWRAKRAAAFEYYDPICRQCGATHELEVHHKTYARFGGRERLTDLEILCAPCHARHHAKLPPGPGVQKLDAVLAEYTAHALPALASPPESTP